MSQFYYVFLSLLYEESQFEGPKTSSDNPYTVKTKGVNIGVRWSKSVVVAVISIDSRVHEPGTTYTSIKAE